MSAQSVQLQQLASVPLAVVRRRVAAPDLSRVVPEGCGLVWNALRTQEIKPGRHVALYWTADIRLEVGVELAESFVEKDELVRSATPAGLVAFSTHSGPYDNLRKTHQAVQAWCRAHGYRLAGPNWEIYGHWEDAWNSDPSKIRTDVFYLVSAS